MCDLHARILCQAEKIKFREEMKEERSIYLFIYVKYSPKKFLFLSFQSIIRS